jgi:hypothetical protein
MSSKTCFLCSSHAETQHSDWVDNALQIVGKGVRSKNLLYDTDHFEEAPQKDLLPHRSRVDYSGQLLSEPICGHYEEIRRRELDIVPTHQSFFEGQGQH